VLAIKKRKARKDHEKNFGGGCRCVLMSYVNVDGRENAGAKEEHPRRPFYAILKGPTMSFRDSINFTI